MSLINNPIALVFISYGIGAMLTSILVSTRLIRHFADSNYITDEWTEKLGVLHFGWLIKNTFMRLFNDSVFLKDKKDKESLKTLINEMTKAEVGHLIGFVVLFILNIYMVFIGVGLFYIVAFFIINLVFNLYLVFLQQYNKRRVKRLLGRT